MVIFSCIRSHWIGTMSTSMDGLAAMKASCRLARYSSVRPSYSAQKKVTLAFCAQTRPPASRSTRTRIQRILFRMCIPLYKSF
ncbi:MAG: hypothetical protein A2064_12055 [Spirochaetes bacterium GWB1_66_5]|nr:MAG: hypothetical protein A2064_12055 [Spirochaetes bacterium GWB1_66_5]